MRPGRQGIFGPAISYQDGKCQIDVICDRRREKKKSYLNCGDTTKSPEVTIAYPGMLLLDLLHEVASDVKTVVGAVFGFRFKTHGSIVTVMSS